REGPEARAGGAGTGVTGESMEQPRRREQGLPAPGAAAIVRGTFGDMQRRRLIEGVGSFLLGVTVSAVVYETGVRRPGLGPEAHASDGPDLGDERAADPELPEVAAISPTEATGLPEVD